MLGIFQHCKPVLNGLADILTLVDLADKYAGLPAVSRAVRLHLIECGGNTSDLYRNIAQDPVDYLYIGEKTRSSIITKEAATHVLGTWSERKTRCRELISSRLFDALARIHDELRTKKELANRALLSLNYDPVMVVSCDAMDDAAAALVLMREHISEAYYNCLQHKSPERFEGNLYREIIRSHNKQKPSLEQQMWAAQDRSFEDDCEVLERKVRDAVGDLGHSYLRINHFDVNAGYILCGKLEDTDLTWEEEW
jgi:hypothetical protein